MNVKRMAVVVACLATLLFPTSVPAQTPVLVAQSTADDDAYQQFLHGVTNLSDLTETQKHRMIRIIASASSQSDDMTAVQHECEQRIWGILTPKQQDELKSQNPNLYPPS